MTDSCKESAVSAVKAFLQSTKEERSRKGKYHKYTLEQEEQIAVYAIKHGNHQAMLHFSEILGSPLTDSSVRNLIKMHNIYTPSLKEEIGHFAVKHSIEEAATTFSDWLNRDVSQRRVRKFKAMYESKLPKEQVQSTRKFSYNVKMKKEIGEYACSHSVMDTVDHFSDVFKISVREQTVKKFHKLYLEKYQHLSKNSAKKKRKKSNQKARVLKHTTTQGQNNGDVGMFQQVQNTPVTVFQLNQPTDGGENTAMYYRAASPLLDSQGNSTLSYHTMTNLAPDMSSVVLAPQPRPAYPIALIRSLVVPPLQEAILTILPEEVTKGDDQKISAEVQSSLNTTKERGDSIPANSEQIKDGEVLNEVGLDSKEIEKINPNKNKISEPANRQTKRKQRYKTTRRSYSAYSPEIRAAIGKYAEQHGSYKTGRHFAKILGHDVPESTVRGIREKYLNKKVHCEVTSLGYSQRGRPLRLGKYDDTVQDCIKDLIRSGEKVSSILAIATAKEVINKYEPELLEENGGSLKLNTTWAKSFLKRIGVRNNS